MWRSLTLCVEGHALSFDFEILMLKDRYKVMKDSSRETSC